MIKPPTQMAKILIGNIFVKYAEIGAIIPPTLNAITNHQLI